MGKLMRLTTLEDSFACNFNILVGGTPSTLGVLSIIENGVLFALNVSHVS